MKATIAALRPTWRRSRTTSSCANSSASWSSDTGRSGSATAIASTTASGQSLRSSSGRSHVGRNAAIVAFILLALGLAWRYTPLAEAATPDAVLDGFDRFSGHWWAPLALLVAY